jgi:hypothetical protein
MITTSYTRPPRGGPPEVSDHRERDSGRGYDQQMQTRYLILASLLAGLAILVAAAVWFSGL